jgi:hypothetical protein
MQIAAKSATSFYGITENVFIIDLKKDDSSKRNGRRAFTYCKRHFIDGRRMLTTTSGSIGLAKESKITVLKAFMSSGFSDFSSNFVNFLSDVEIGIDAENKVIGQVFRHGGT